MKAYLLPGDRGSSSCCYICITRETNAVASCGISENFSSCWAQPWAFPDFSPNLAQEIGEQCRLLLVGSPYPVHKRLGSSVQMALKESGKEKNSILGPPSSPCPFRGFPKHGCAWTASGRAGVADVGVRGWGEEVCKFG